MKQIKIALSGYEFDVVLQFGRYSNNRTAIECLDALDGDPVAVATVNLPNRPLESDEVFIKDYSENEGMLLSLIANEIISKPIGVERSGFVEIYKCKLLYSPLDELKG